MVATCGSDASLRVWAAALKPSDGEVVVGGIGPVAVLAMFCVSVLCVCWYTSAHRMWSAASRMLRTCLFAALRENAPLPHHIAFIMDGNRRWARKQGEPDSSGHPRGSDKLICALQWCHEAGIAAVTVYAFSIENFKRPSQEVRSIMDLAELKFAHMLQNSDVVHEYEFRVRVLGDMKLLDPKLRAVMSDAMLATQHYKKHTLNICFAYTARHEMARAVLRSVRQKRAQNCVEALSASLTTEKSDMQRDICEGDIDRHLMTGPSYPDVIVRTSGEPRLSDFMLWQSAFAHIVFLPVLWPEFSVMHFLYVLLSYQHAHRAILRAREVFCVASPTSNAGEYRNSNAKSEACLECRHIAESCTESETPFSAYCALPPVAEAPRLFSQRSSRLLGL